MRATYELQIQLKNKSQDLISEILGVNYTYIRDQLWCFHVIEENDDEYYDFINNFLDILEGKYIKLYELGISSEDVSIWYIYVYSGQCNMEFSPERMKRLGENNIALCISCYEEKEE